MASEIGTVVILGTGGTIAGSAASPADNVGYTAAQIGVAQLVAGISHRHAQVGEPDVVLGQREEVGDAGQRELQPGLQQGGVLELAQRLRSAARHLRHSVCRGVTDHTRQVLLNIPAHVIDQPVDFGGQLHIALNADGRLVALHQRLRHLEG